MEMHVQRRAARSWRQGAIEGQDDLSLGVVDAAHAQDPVWRFSNLRKLSKIHPHYWRMRSESSSLRFYQWVARWRTNRSQN
jgi:hypothetical protein